MNQGERKEASPAHHPKSDSVASVLDRAAPVRLGNILFATDFSSASDAALDHALSIARAYASQIYVAHVIEPDLYQTVPPGALPAVADQIRRSAEQNMADLLISGRLRGVAHQVLLSEGPLWPVLADMILQHEIDLIVVGTHGRTGVRKLLLGSAAEEIFRMAPCPVLTVGPKAAPKAPREGHLARILYATDFTPNSQRGAAYAFSLAQEHQSLLTVVHVVQEGAQASPENRARLVEFFSKRLRDLAPTEAEFWCETEFVVEFGAPADGILQVAVERQVELIVLGVRRSATFAGHLPPATAYKVVCQAPCPVLTIRG